MCLYLQADVATRPSWCGEDARCWAAVKRNRGRGGPRGPDVPCLGPVEPMGRGGRGGTGRTAAARSEKTAGCSIYTAPLCAFPGCPPSIWLQLCLFLSTHQEEVWGVKRAEGQITSTLCLDFAKYLPATGSIPFHFTNKLEIHRLLLCFTEPSSCVRDSFFKNTQRSYALERGKKRKSLQRVKVIILHSGCDAASVYTNDANQLCLIFLMLCFWMFTEVHLYNLKIKLHSDLRNSFSMFWIFLELDVV